MPYESAINESDIALRAQLDRAKLGTGTVGSNDQITADVAWTNLPEEMSLQDVMKGRAVLGLESMRMGRLIADDKKAQREADEFDAFSQEIQGLSPGDMEANASVLSNLSKRYAGNKEIQDAVNTASENDLRVSKARANAFESKKQEDDEELYNTTSKSLKDAALIETRNRLEKAKLEETGWQRAVAEDGTKDEAAFGETVGTIMQRDRQLGDAIAEFGVSAKHANLDPLVSKKLYNVLGVFSKSMALEDVVGTNLKNANFILDAAKRSVGVDLRTLSDEERVRAIEKIKNPTMRGRISEAYADIKEYQDASTSRATIGKAIMDLLSNPPKKGDEEGNIAFEKNLEKLTMRAAAASKGVDILFKQKEQHTKDAETARKVEKDLVDLQAKRAGMADKEYRREYSTKMLNLRKQMADDRKLYMLYSLNHDKRKGKEIKPFEEWQSELDQYEKEALSGGNDAYGSED